MHRILKMIKSIRPIDYKCESHDYGPKEEVRKEAGNRDALHKKIKGCM